MDGTLLIAGVSRAHDALLAASLRALGLDVATAPTPGSPELARGRALLPRGYPISSAALAGALVCTLERAPTLRAPITYVVYAGSAPGLASDYRLALARAGFADVRVVAFGPHVTDWASGLAALGLPSSARVVRALLDTVVIGDVVLRRASEARSRMSNVHAVDNAVNDALTDLASCLAERGDPGPRLRALDRALSPRSRKAARRAVRVAVLGDPFCSTTDGALGCGVRAWLESRGAHVEPPTVSTWIAELAFRAGLLPVVRLTRALYAHRARQAGVSPRSADPAETAALVERTCGATQLPVTAHALVGGYLRRAREGTTDLVVALDPFLCTVSTAIAAARVHSLATGHRPHFVALELSGDSEAQIESRLDLALDLARSGGAMA